MMTRTALEDYDAGMRLAQSDGGLHHQTMRTCTHERSNTWETEMSNETPKDNEALEVKVLRQVLQLQPVVYTNFINQPCIELPLNENSDRRSYQLRDDRVRSELGEFSWQTCGALLSEQQISRIIRFLEGLALKDKRCDPDLEDALNEDPLLEAVNIYLRLSKTNGRFRGSCTKLLEDLNGITKAYGVDSGHRLWPKGPAQLSRRIADLEPLLTKVGIEAESARNPGGARFMRLKLNQACDDGDATAS